MTSGLLQTWVLRLVGAVEMLAFGAVFLPRDWMEAIHAGMGLTRDAEGTRIRFGNAPSVVLLRTAWRGTLVHRRGRRALPSPGDLDGDRLPAGRASFFVIDLANGMPWSWIAGNGGSVS